MPELRCYSGLRILVSAGGVLCSVQMTNDLIASFDNPVVIDHVKGETIVLTSHLACALLTHLAFGMCSVPAPHAGLHQCGNPTMAQGMSSRPSRGPICSDFEPSWSRSCRTAPCDIVAHYIMTLHETICIVCLTH